MRTRLLAAAVLTVIAGLATCRDAPRGPVRSPMRAAEIAQGALRAAGRDELVVDARRVGDAWIVTTRWRETSVAGHIVTVDAATGEARVERYRSVGLGRVGQGR